VRSACRKYCLETIQLAEKILELTHDGHAECDDDRCLLLFGTILDSASRIRMEAEKRLKNLEMQSAKHGIRLKGPGFDIPG